jgi:hypothetical protein
LGSTHSIGSCLWGNRFPLTPPHSPYITRDITDQYVPRQRGDVLPTTELTSPFGQSAKAEDTPSFEFSASPDALGHSYFSNPFKGQEQEGTDATDPSIASLPRMVRDIKRRVSDCSTDYAFQLCTLIKEFTISISSDDGRSSSRRLSAAVSEASLPGDPPPHEAVPEVYESFPDPGFAHPGDFLTAHTRSCADFPGQQHGKGNCWCSISKKTSAEEGSWVLPTGELSARARRVLAHPSPAHLGNGGAVRPREPEKGQHRRTDLPSRPQSRLVL